MKIENGFCILISLVVLVSGQRNSNDRGDRCDGHRDCKNDEKCVDLLGTCELPDRYNGSRPVYCQTDSQCRQRTGSRKDCNIYQKGRCMLETRVCRDESDLWVEDCPRGSYCDDRQNCVRDDRNSNRDRIRDRDRDRYDDDGDFCSVTRKCPSGQTCCSDNRCSRDRSCTCSRSDPRGTCPLGEECQGTRRPECRRITCDRDSNRNDCPRGFECSRSGECREDRDYVEDSRLDNRDRDRDRNRDREEECSRNNRNGWCPRRRVCQSGRCIPISNTSSNPCSKKDKNGSCPRGQICRRGECQRDEDDEDDEHRHQFCRSGYCDNRGDVCQGGYCVREDEPCSSRNRRGFCRRRGDYCDDGICVEDRYHDDDDDRYDTLRGESDRPCSRSNRRGYCRARGDVCRDGECVRSDQDDDQCSRDNRNGYCPFGYYCHGGSCVRDEYRDEHDDDRRGERCSTRRPDDCRNGYFCDRGECVRLRESDLCSLSNRRGHCERRNYECIDGYCEEIYDDRRTSSSSTSPRCVYDADCRSDEICDDRRSECRIKCSERNPDGFCPGRNEICNRRGLCELDRREHLEHEHRDCHADRDCHNGQECIRGRCLDVPCSQDNYYGRCPPNRTCDQGVCVRRGREEEFSFIGPLPNFGDSREDDEGVFDVERGTGK